MLSVFTVPVTVGCDARYAGAGPGRLHLNACVCGRIESIAGRMSGDRSMREGKRTLNYRETGSERACGTRSNRNQLEREPLRYLGMSRGDGRCA
jgi:hypothetical protein